MTQEEIDLLRETLADMTQQRNRYRAEAKRLRAQLADLQAAVRNTPRIPVDKPTGGA